MDNADLRERAGALFPGGVSSPVRSFRSIGGEPVPIARASGARLFDAEGTEYIDYVAAYGPLILGHAHPAVVAALGEAAAGGTAFGALSPGEVELGKRISEATGLERLRFVNSGTEATMTAIRLARAATGRDLVVKFEGCYHGHSDGLLVKAGSGVATLGLSDSAGVPESIAAGTAVLPYNDADALAQWFEAHGDESAAVIVEPVAGNMGVVPPETAFLDALQTLPHRHGALLINDEIITGFRLRYGLSGLLPDADIVCLGKVIGGRVAGGGAGRTGGADVAAGAGRAGLPGGDAQREPTRDGRGRRHAGRALRRASVRARGGAGAIPRERSGDGGAPLRGGGVRRAAGLAAVAVLPLAAAARLRGGRGERHRYVRQLPPGHAGAGA